MSQSLNRFRFILVPCGSRHFMTVISFEQPVILAPGRPSGGSGMSWITRIFFSNPEILHGFNGRGQNIATKRVEN
jgi:hypothetical protein